MRISEYFNLGLEQPSLDFVDVQVNTDTALFIDPTALCLLDTEWGARSRALIQDYFSLILNLIKTGQHAQARKLLSVLNEPNETRLGYSSEKPHGHGMGRQLAQKMWNELKESSAVSSGIIHDLEDTALMIDGIASDVISDIVTNIIREPLLEYTAEMCEEYGIPTQKVGSKPIWNTVKNKWETRFVKQPVVNGARLLLVPKALVRQLITYQADSYYNLYLLEQIQEEHVAQGFVRLLKNGDVRPPTKKSLKAKFKGVGKEQNRTQTIGREEVLRKYRDDKQNEPREPLSHEIIAEVTGTTEPGWDDMLSRLNAIPSGKAHAKQYEMVVRELFFALFYPWLMHPVSQERIHNGKKIIDITFWNMAEDDFFAWLRDNYPAQFIVVECKNYSEDPVNPELDQLAGRFSPRRGKFGLLVCRKISDRDRFDERCRDTADDERGYIVGIDDDDIRQLVEAVRFGKKGEHFEMLKTRFKKLVM